MKLSQRNGKGSGVYGVHHDGLDFHVVKDGMRKGWIVTVRELVETAGVVHCLGQPNLFIVHEETLQDVRDALDHWSEVEGPATWWRWSQACSQAHKTRMARRAEKFAREMAEYDREQDEEQSRWVALNAGVDALLGR